MMDRGQWVNLASMPVLQPYSFSKDILGFLMTTESQDLGLTSHPKDSNIIIIITIICEFLIGYVQKLRQLTCCPIRQ